ncbi:MAG: transcriptional regulator [Nitrosopumilus sp.]|nr:transcriptional regulator [Nitrosopumilus sp.]
MKQTFSGKLNTEQIANNFLELASEQRLNILKNLSDRNLNISKLAKLLGATNPEVHRNVGRLSKSGLIVKNPDGNFELTTFGKAVMVQIPSINFVSEDKDFFNSHSLGNVNSKFIQRLGALQDKKKVKGFVKVLEKLQKIQEEADEFIFNILSEVPYSKEIVDVISKKLENKVLIRSIFSANTIVPENRKKVFEEKGFQKYVTDGNLERRISKNIVIGLLVTDKEGGVFFQNKDGELDLSEMYTSTASEFREWCLDYFNDQWKNSTSFQESKLKG